MMKSDDKTSHPPGHSFYVKSLDHIDPDERDAGGKAGRLALLRRAGFPVPKAFVVLAGLYRQVQRLGASMAELNSLPSETFAAVGKMYKQMFNDLPVVVRSSATCEDSTMAAYAGVFESVLDVTGTILVNAIWTVYRSVNSRHAQDYIARQRDAKPVEMAVIVQEQIEPQWAGVAFTADPVSGAPNLVVEYVKGRSERLLLGQASPSRIVLDANLDIVSKYYARKEDEQFAEYVTSVATHARRAADLFGKPQDMEWLLDVIGTLFIVQSRDVTSLPAPQRSEPAGRFATKPAATGLPISPGLVTGSVRILHSSLTGEEAEELITPGSIAVAQLLSSDHISALTHATGIITSEASLLSHPAVTARELHIPCVGDVAEAVRLFSPDETLTVDGERGLIYRGLVEVDVATVPASVSRLLYYNPDRVSALPTELGPVLYEVVDGMVYIYPANVVAEQANQQARDAVARHLQISSDAVLIDRHGLWEGPSGPSVVYSQYQVLARLRQSRETARLLDAAEQALERLDVRELTALLEHIDELARGYFVHAVAAWNEFKISKKRDHVDEAAAKLDMARCYAGDVVETILQVLSQARLERVLKRLDGDHHLVLPDVYRMAHNRQDKDQFFKPLPASEQIRLTTCLEIVRTLESFKDRRLEVLTFDDTSFFDILEGMDQAGLGDVIEHYGW